MDTKACQRGSAALLLTAVFGCGSGTPAPGAAPELSSAPETTGVEVTTVPAATDPATTVEATDAPATTVAVTSVPATTLANTASSVPMTLDELAALLPIVDGYQYAEMVETSAWSLFDPDELTAEQHDLVELDELASTVSRAVYVEGGNPEFKAGWVGEVSVFDAGEKTRQLWLDVVERHWVFCLSSPPESGFYVFNTVRGSWRAIGNEAVLFGDAEPDGDIGAAWFHDGRIFAVSGWSSSEAYIEGLIAQLQVDSSEPEWFDFVALEGTLSEVMVDVPGFRAVDPRPTDLAWMLNDVNKCVQHLSLHWIYPTDQMGVSMEVYMAGWAEPSPCERGAWIIDKELFEGGTRQDFGGVPAVISEGGEQVMIVADTGVYVSAIVHDAEHLATFMPVLEKLAAAAAATEI